MERAPLWFADVCRFLQAGARLCRHVDGWPRIMRVNEVGAARRGFLSSFSHVAPCGHAAGFEMLSKEP